MTGFHWIWVAALLAISFTHTVLFQQKQHLRDMVFFLAMPVLILLAHSVVPFPRTFSYYVLILVILALLPYREYLASVAPRRILVTLLIVQALCCWRFFEVIRPYEERDPQVNMTVWDINKNIMGDKRYFSAGTLMGTNLRFELETRYGLHDHITFRDLPVDADTLTGYDHIIVGRLLDSTKFRKPEYASPYFNVYGSRTEPIPGLTK